MIYLVYGNNNSQKSERIKDLALDSGIVRILSDQITSNALVSLAHQSVLFGTIPIVVIENALAEAGNILDDTLLSTLKDSQNIFIFLEDNLTQVVIKKYKKYFEDVIVCESKVPPKPQTNSFIVADMYSRRDKVGAWTSYLGLIEEGVAPEAISGILFWKNKMLLSSPNNKFTKAELEIASSELVRIYHQSHLGEIDMAVGLESFILKTL